MHHYQFHIGDFISHTHHLSNEEELCYRRLLDYYYLHEKPITQNNPLVSRKMKVSQEVLETVLNEFFELTPEGWINKRADEEIADYHAYLEKQKSNGIKGGRPKNNPEKPTGNPPITQVEPKITLTNNHNHNHNQEPIINTPAKAVASMSNKDALSFLYNIPDLPKQVADDWLAVRKSKKAPLTMTALAGIQREADKAGITMARAITECASRNWQGFKADWYAKDAPKSETAFTDQHTDNDWHDQIISAPQENDTDWAEGL